MRSGENFYMMIEIKKNHKKTLKYFEKNLEMRRISIQAPEVPRAKIEKPYSNINYTEKKNVSHKKKY